MIAWDRIEELEEEIGEEDFREVVALFLEEVDEVMERLRGAPPDSGYGDDLHFLRGSALNLGFQALGDACRQGEMQISATSSGTVDIAPVIRTYETSRAEFLTQLDSRQARAP